MIGTIETPPVAGATRVRRKTRQAARTKAPIQGVHPGEQFRRRDPLSEALAELFGRRKHNAPGMQCRQDPPGRNSALRFAG